MKLRHPLISLCMAGLIMTGAGCATSSYTTSPSTYDQGGGALMVTNIISPKNGDTFPAGKDIPIEAAAMDMSGVGQVIIIVNGKNTATDTQRPFRAILKNPAPGQYAIQAAASNSSGDSKLSPAVVINVK